MFDFNWSEIALIGVVALVLIGPKDMPVAIRAITNAIKKMRRMAGEFQHHVDDMLRDADLAEVKSSIDEIRGMNVKGSVRRVLDPDGAIGRAFDDPFAAHPVKPVMTASGPVSIAAPPPLPEALPLPEAPPLSEAELHPAGRSARPAPIQPGLHSGEAARTRLHPP